jgi:hypothetical protein
MNQAINIDAQIVAHPLGLPGAGQLPRLLHSISSAQPLSDGRFTKGHGKQRERQHYDKLGMKL